MISIIIWGWRYSPSHT